MWLLHELHIRRVLLCAPAVLWIVVLSTWLWVTLPSSARPLNLLHLAPPRRELPFPAFMSQNQQDITMILYLMI